jgi:divalent metal cation (Fe/Co/Zn/Cd) transporter
MPQAPTTERSRFVERGRRLEYFTILWNSLAGLTALISGFIAWSVALVGFGLDSLIEVTSGAALLWRLDRDGNTFSREKAEQLTLRIVGSCFLLLSVYIGYDSLDSLVSAQAPARSLPGNRDRSRLVGRYALAIPSKETHQRRIGQRSDGR